MILSLGHTIFGFFFCLLLRYWLWKGMAKLLLSMNEWEPLKFMCMISIKLLVHLKDLP